MKALPAMPYGAVVKLERRASHEGMVSVRGNYSVPDTTSRRSFDVHVLAEEIRISKTVPSSRSTPLWKGGARSGSILYRKPVGSCRHGPRGEPPIVTRAGDRVVRRSLDFYAAVGRRLGGLGGVR